SSSCDVPSSVALSWGGAAASVPAGDGSVYAQSEDDKTIYHFGRNCELLGVYSHAMFNESSKENDEIACDTVTFGRPAIWLQDARVGLVAYEVPGGYCPVPSDLRVVPDQL